MVKSFSVAATLLYMFLRALCNSVMKFSALCSFAAIPLSCSSCDSWFIVIRVDPCNPWSNRFRLRRSCPMKSVVKSVFGYGFTALCSSVSIGGQIVLFEPSGVLPRRNATSSREAFSAKNAYLVILVDVLNFSKRNPPSGIQFRTADAIGLTIGY